MTITRRALGAMALGAAAARSANAAPSLRVDAHTHAFVRGLKLAVDARYAPNYDASWQTLLALADTNGIGRAVLGSDAQAVLRTSGWRVPLNSLPGHMACRVVIPLRLGMRVCTSAIFLSVKV